MPTSFDYFIAPLRDDVGAQVATLAVLILILMDWVFGLVNAIFIQHNFASDVMRQGIVHKCVEMGILCVGLVINAIFDAGIKLPLILELFGDLFDNFGEEVRLPIYVLVVAYIAAMEIGSLLEIFVEINPDLAGSPLFKRLAVANQTEEDQQWLTKQ